MEQQAVTHWSLWKRQHRLTWDTTFSQNELSTIGIILTIKRLDVTMSDQSTSSKGIWKDLNSQKRDLLVGNWCYLIFWGSDVPSGRPLPVSYTVPAAGASAAAGAVFSHTGNSHVHLAVKLVHGQNGDKTFCDIKTATENQDRMVTGQNGDKLNECTWVCVWTSMP